MTTTVDPALVNALVAFVSDRGGAVSFPEMLQFLEGQGEAVKGTWCIDLPGNVVLYAGMSEAAVDIIRAALPELDPSPSSLLVYLVDGGMLTFPLAKRIPKGGYRTPHWLPVVFWPKGKVPG